MVSSPEVRPFGSFADLFGGDAGHGAPDQHEVGNAGDTGCGQERDQDSEYVDATRWLGSLGSNQEHALEHEGGNGPGSTVESVKQACNTPYPVEEIVASRLRTEQLPVDSPAATSELRSAWPTEGAQ